MRAFNYGLCGTLRGLGAYLRKTTADYTSACAASLKIATLPFLVAQTRLSSLVVEANRHVCITKSIR